jgi:predicted amidohydrolase
MSSQPLPSFTLALAQMLVEPGQRRANLERAVARIGTAADHGARVVLLPETVDFGWTDPQSRMGAGPVPGGEVCEALRAAARRHHVYVCAGLTERAGDAVYNAAVLLSPSGDLLLRHRKINELAIAHDLYDQGNQLGVAETAHGMIGVMICADARTPGECVPRTLGHMGADLILSPCAWAVPPGYDERARPYGIEWRESYAAVARDFNLWIAGCSNVGPVEGGPWRGYACIGKSLVYGPQGEPVAVGSYGEKADELIYVEVKPIIRPLRSAGWRQIPGSFTSAGAR